MIMSTERFEDILQLIDRIYDAVLDPELWPAFAEHLCKVVPSTDLNINSIDIEDGKANLAFSMTPPEVMQHYLENYHAINPYLQSSYREMKTGAMFRSHEVCPPDEFEQTEFYKDFFSKLNLFHAMHMSVLLEDGLVSGISVARTKEMGTYTDAEADVFRILLPHLQRAFRIGDLLADMKLELNKALDRLP